MKPDTVNVTCSKCRTTMPVPVGGKRLCGCGTWISGTVAATAMPAAMPIPAAPHEAMPVDEPARPAAPKPTLGARPTPAVADQWPRIEGDLAAIERLSDGYRRICKELGKAIVGQQQVLEELLIAIFARGHCLLVGVPGLAKTLMIRTLSDCLNLSFSRIQFTPDLMPSDITGTEVLQEDKTSGQRLFKFLHGPIFANIVLADEINRTPPKTQAALLEAMQEKQVTIGGARHKLPDPFFVLATQNPIEQEGTYPLPEAQQDRFMFNVMVDYPEEEEEFRIVEMTTAQHVPNVERVLTAADILEMQDIVRKVPVAPYVIRYAMRFTRLTRKEKGQVPDFIRDYVTWGAGPRATQNLVLAGKARAVLHGRYYVSCEDIRAVAIPVLRHRILTNFNAEAEGIKPEDIVKKLADMIPRDPNEEKLAQGQAPAPVITK
jgi:MoxR-like ATPase